MSRWLRHHVVEAMPSHIVGWIIGGAIVALSGVSPDEWVAHLVHASSEFLPSDWSAAASALVVRSSFAALGLAVIVSTLRLTRGPKGIPAPATVPETSTNKAVPRLSIVVLPFVNLSGDPEQEYFVDGVTESLTTDLSRLAGSFVIGRNTAFTCRFMFCAGGTARMRSREWSQPPKIARPRLPKSSKGRGQAAVVLAYLRGTDVAPWPCRQLGW